MKVGGRGKFHMMTRSKNGEVLLFWWWRRRVSACLSKIYLTNTSVGRNRDVFIRN